MARLHLRARKGTRTQHGKRIRLYGYGYKTAAKERHQHTPNSTQTKLSQTNTHARIVSAGLIPLTIAPFAAGSLNPVTDSILCALLVVHSHIGFEACVIDYFPKNRVPKVRAAANWALRAGTVLLGVALYSFETNDVGVTEAVRRLWTA